MSAKDVAAGQKLDPTVDIRAMMLAQAQWLGLTIDPAHQPGVTQFLSLSNMMAQKVLAHPLGPMDEPANVFTPVTPPERSIDEPQL